MKYVATMLSSLSSSICVVSDAVICIGYAILLRCHLYEMRITAKLVFIEYLL